MNLIEQFTNSWKLFCQPPRQIYQQFDLGSPIISIRGRKFKRNDIRIQNKRGFILECSFYEPLSNFEGECVIYLHCFNGSRLESIKFAEPILQNGCGFCHFDFSGSGLSEGEFVSLGYFEQQDVQSVIDHLKSSFRVSKIALWGRSMGAVTALLYTQKFPEEVQALAIDSAFICMYETGMQIADKKVSLPSFIVKEILDFIKRQIKKNVGYYMEEVNTIKYLSNCKMPILFIASKEDTLVSYQNSEKLFEAYPLPIPQKKIIFVKGTHNDPRDWDVILKIANFLTEKIVSQTKNLVLDHESRQSLEMCRQQQTLLNLKKLQQFRIDQEILLLNKDNKTDAPESAPHHSFSTCSIGSQDNYKDTSVNSKLSKTQKIILDIQNPSFSSYPKECLNPERDFRQMLIQELKMKPQPSQHSAQIQLLTGSEIYSNKIRQIKLLGQTEQQGISQDTHIKDSTVNPEDMKIENIPDEIEGEIDFTQFKDFRVQGKVENNFSFQVQINEGTAQSEHIFGKRNKNPQTSSISSQSKLDRTEKINHGPRTSSTIQAKFPLAQANFLKNNNQSTNDQNYCIQEGLIKILKNQNETSSPLPVQQIKTQKDDCQITQSRSKYHISSKDTTSIKSIASEISNSNPSSNRANESNQLSLKSESLFDLNFKPIQNSLDNISKTTHIRKNSNQQQKLIQDNLNLLEWKKIDRRLIPPSDQNNKQQIQTLNNPPLSTQYTELIKDEIHPYSIERTNSQNIVHPSNSQIYFVSNFLDQQEDNTQQSFNKHNSLQKERNRCGSPIQQKSQNIKLLIPSEPQNKNEVQVCLTQFTSKPNFNYQNQSFQSQNINEESKSVSSFPNDIPHKKPKIISKQPKYEIRMLVQQPNFCGQKTDYEQQNNKKQIVLLDKYLPTPNEDLTQNLLTNNNISIDTLNRGIIQPPQFLHSNEKPNQNQIDKATSNLIQKNQIDFQKPEYLDNLGEFITPIPNQTSTKFAFKNRINQATKIIETKFADRDHFELIDHTNKNMQLLIKPYYEQQLSPRTISQNKGHSSINSLPKALIPTQNNLYYKSKPIIHKQFEDFIQ